MPPENYLPLYTRLNNEQVIDCKYFPTKKSRKEYEDSHPLPIDALYYSYE